MWLILYSSNFNYQLVCRNSTPYVLQTTDKISCTVTHTATSNVIPVVIEPSPYTGSTTVTISFTVRISGQYTVQPYVNGVSITAGSCKRNYAPGPVDASKTEFLSHQHTHVITRGIYYPLRIAPRDSFGNRADITSEYLCVEARKVCDSREGGLCDS